MAVETNDRIKCFVLRTLSPVTCSPGTGVTVMVVPWNKCHILLFVDGLRCMARETNDRRLRSLQ
jgi:hypothetical protein